jgi:hypothetical protein
VGSAVDGVAQGESVALESHGHRLHQSDDAIFPPGSGDAVAADAPVSDGVGWNPTLRWRSAQRGSLRVESPRACKWILLFGHRNFEFTRRGGIAPVARVSRRDIFCLLRPSKMDEGMADGLKSGPSDYLAAERTFLAWIRTGLALMGFGFVVARFGLFL